MNEFLEMIFRSYTNTSDSKSYLGDETDRLLDELEKILSPELNKKINDYFIDASAEIEKTHLWTDLHTLANAYQMEKSNLQINTNQF